MLRNMSRRALTVLVDMDGVLADLDPHWLKIWRQKYPEEPYIPLEDRRTFYLNEQYNDHEKVETILTEDGFFRTIPPIEGGCEALKEMSSMKNVNVFICSSPMITSYEACSREKGAWIVEHLGRDWLRRFVLTSDKTVVRGDILIDDKHRITGAMKPVWEHVVFTACHNKHIDLKGRLRLDSWKREEWTNLIEHYKRKFLS